MYDANISDSRGQPITWLTSSDPRTISLVAPSPIDSGVQVYNNYGPKPNEELLLGYGFVLNPNPDDVLPLRLGGIGSNVSANKKARLTSKGLDAGKRWIIKRDGEIPRDLMEVLRIVMGDEHHHDHDDDEEEEEEEHGHWEQEMELELDVLGALGQMLDDKLAKLESVNSEVEARDDVRAMCDVYRRGELALVTYPSQADVIGQIEILTKAMEVIEERIERVERLTAEGEGCPCCN
jgi:hypothetical protein